ncbi:MAG: 6-phosphogluconolactonase [Acidobacteriota bacterium]|nr:6-phosphogluconolactonase [Acidobacteriota bacterium]
MNNLENVIVLDSPEDVARAGAERFVSHAQTAIDDHDVFSVALAGGNTPRRMYQLLASDSFRNEIHWNNVHLFFGDERCVPPNDPDSNYRLAREALISRVQIPVRNVHPINGEGDPIENAKLYEDELRSFFAGRQWPQFDLVLLGLGTDGHSASLFPLTPALRETRSWVASNWVEKLEAFRVTLTVPAINSAANVFFLVTGSEKAAPLAAVTNGPPQPELLPAQLIKPSDGSLKWLVDRAAASRLTAGN